MEPVSPDIIQQAVRGDSAAFEIIHRSLYDFVFRLVIRILRNEEEAKDTTQEVFLKIHQHLPQYNETCSFRAWVGTIARNTAFTLYQQQKRRSQQLEHYHLLSESLTSQKTPQIALPEDLDHTLRSGMFSALTAEQRLCVLLTYADGLSYKETAARLHISIDAVRSQLKQAREKIRKKRQ